MAEAIKSFIFFDMEATGLPQFEGSPKITELSFVACSADHFMASSRQEVPEIPRVLHKLSFCVNPFKRISEESSRITGLDNYNLENESNFNVRELEMIKKFVERLQQPACLVAHNGNSYDYPILRKEFQKHNIEVPENLLCVDSLKVFKKIDKDREIERQEDEELAEFIRTELKEIEEAEEEHRRLIKEFGGENSGAFQENSELCNQYEILEKIDSKAHQKLNETTPNNSTMTNIPPRAAKKKSAEGSSQETPKKAEVVPEGNIGKSKRQLFPVKKKYRLPDIYQRLYGEDPEDTHRAESDCYILMKCALKEARDFLSAAQAVSKPFVDISAQK
ncbi:uncharacterized protein LOC129794312 [Lutzomyia longipalpis]|uniref:uncharacterized protein LOC129794312 n=1 Tax=Lutzomyia longipalpis TaxID=7200 RepID=UPI0024846141|nr:uncharacterized protein LOC129794312 [Lutzomyia longipalpis]